MQPAIHITTTVLPDNRIEIDLPPGTAGQQVTVFVVLTDNNPKATTNKRPLASPAELETMPAAPNIQSELAVLNTLPIAPAKPRAAVPEILARIRRRPRVNPLEFDLPDSNDLIREDRER